MKIAILMMIVEDDDDTDAITEESSWGGEVLYLGDPQTPEQVEMMGQALARRVIEDGVKELNAKERKQWNALTKEQKNDYTARC